MPLTQELRTSYEAVLRDLQTEEGEIAQEISARQSRLKDIHHSIATLMRRLNPDAPPSRPLAPSRPPTEKYANMSVRWAILDLLSESQPKTTAEIADALIAGGVKTKAVNFANNVSAVLSTSMKEQHHEVQQLPDNKWELTENGRSAIEHIRTTPKFRGATRARAYDARF